MKDGDFFEHFGIHWTTKRKERVFGILQWRARMFHRGY
jgi:hypothetical protein